MTNEELIRIVVDEIYEVDDIDLREEERARGGYRVKHQYAGTGCIEKRHYRQEYNRMVDEITIKVIESIKK